MSLILYGGGVTEARGSVGGTTMSRTRGGAIHRNKTSPTQWKSDFRQVSKALLSTVSGMWASTLTAAERTAWNHFGLITPSTNVYGQTTYLSGHQWFCKCSINLLIAGLAVNTGAPATATVPGPTSLSVVATHTGVDSLALTYADAGAPASCYINLRVSQPISRGISYCNNEFRTLEIRGNPGSPYNPVALYLTRFPEFIYSIGRKIFVLLAYMDGATGIMSPAVIADAIIT